MELVKLGSMPYWASKLQDKRLVMALGNFDGVHVGHQYLLKKMIKFAQQTNNISAVLLFYPHPQQIIDKHNAPKMLLDFSKKLDILTKLGVEVAVTEPFDEKLASFSPEQFVKNVLVDKLKVYAVFIGFNYRFGNEAKGTPEMLLDYGKKYNFYVVVVEPVVKKGTPVSSSIIRRAIEKGDIVYAKELLGYWPLIKGKVILGDQRGRKLGFPTANIDVPDDIIIPGRGVYAGRAHFDGKEYPAVLNIGYRPTFYNSPEAGRYVEVHMLGYNGDSYNKIIEIEIYKKLRDEKKFNDAKELILQISKDIDEAVLIYKNYYETYNNNSNMFC